ncbi:hypothetical protein M404DRAFT_998906, partial [Pisolithus tinctorius Marx 270]
MSNDRLSKRPCRTEHDLASAVSSRTGNASMTVDWTGLRVVKMGLSSTSSSQEGVNGFLTDGDSVYIHGGSRRSVKHNASGGSPKRCKRERKKSGKVSHRWEDGSPVRRQPVHCRLM